MTLDMGLFFGLCLFVAFYIGRKYEEGLARRYFLAVMGEMNNDMDGAVEKWYKMKMIEVLKK